MAVTAGVQRVCAVLRIVVICSRGIANKSISREQAAGKCSRKVQSQAAGALGSLPTAG